MEIPHKWIYSLIVALLLFLGKMVNNLQVSNIEKEKKITDCHEQIYLIFKESMKMAELKRDISNIKKIDSL